MNRDVSDSKQNIFDLEALSLKDYKDLSLKK